MSGFLTGRTSMFKVQTADIAADAVTAAKLPDDVIDSEHYAATSIDTAHLGNLQVTTAKIAADAIDGTKIADDAIDSEHYAAGSIDSAHLADDAVTLAKMVSATDGVIITYDASGNPTHVGPGTDGQLLTSTGAGSPPAFEDAAGGGPSQATQAALEAETNEDTYAPPDLIKHSPGVAKAWVKFDRAGTVNASQNITSVTDTGAGNWTVNIATNFSSADYTVVLGFRRNSGLPDAIFTAAAQAAGTIQVIRGDTNGDIADAAAADDMHVTMFGDQ